MKLLDIFYCLKFNNESLIDKKIGNILAYYLFTIVHMDRVLLNNVNPCPTKLEC